MIKGKWWSLVPISAVSALCLTFALLLSFVTVSVAEPAADSTGGQSALPRRVVDLTDMVHIAPGELPRVERTNKAGEPTPVTAGFFIDRTEVTNRQFARFLSDAENNRAYLDDRMDITLQADGTFLADPGKENNPVTFVDWFAAWAYSVWAGKTLPTEEEWILAALGTFNGQDLSEYYAWGTTDTVAVKADLLKRKTIPHPVPVDSNPSSATVSGILGLAGNVAEWTSSFRDVVDSAGDTTRFYIIKGGSFLDPVENTKLNIRQLRLPGEKLRSIGFRCIVRDEAR